MISAEVLREAAVGPLSGRLPTSWLEEHVLLPVHIDEGRGEVVIAAGCALDATVTDEVARLFGLPVRVEEASPNDIRSALLAAQHEATLAATDASLTTESGVASAGDEGLGDLRARANDAPVVQLVNALIADAVRLGASDVHLESERGALRVRMREDGVLRDVASYGREYQGGVVSRVKLLAGLDIAERRVPQDGRARVRLGSREVDLRVSTLPALHGESVVLRLLDQSAGVRELQSLGMRADTESAFGSLVRQSTGLVLVSGPTGSGKTTTLYAAMATRNRPSVKIVTVEDPVEYQIPGVTQIPVNRKAGLGFASALRSILRHDPDIIMIGELRDRETAEVAVQAALTGHLVFSTLHTNDAPSGVTRLIDMGIEPYLVAATLQGIVAQRLVRLVCTRCASAIAGDDAQLMAFGNSHPSMDGARRGRGCEECNGTGYRGRTGLYELYAPDAEERRRIARPHGTMSTDGQGRDLRAMTLQQHGATLVAQGLTTQEEVRRVIAAADDSMVRSSRSIAGMR
ncbi:MAG: GspE/PulE family protein [Gemmatimonadaceae bacterium]